MPAFYALNLQWSAGVWTRTSLNKARHGASWSTPWRSRQVESSGATLFYQRHLTFTLSATLSKIWHTARKRAIQCLPRAGLWYRGPNDFQQVVEALVDLILFKPWAMSPNRSWPSQDQMPLLSGRLEAMTTPRVREDRSPEGKTPIQDPRFVRVGSSIHSGALKSPTCALIIRV